MRARSTTRLRRLLDSRVSMSPWCAWWSDATPPHPQRESGERARIAHPLPLRTKNAVLSRFMRMRAPLGALLLIGLAPVAVTACDMLKKKDAAADAGTAASTAAAATTAATDPTPATAAPSTTTAPALPGHGGAVRPRLPDGGLGPLTFPDGGIPALPSGIPALPSGFPTVLPSNLPPIPSGFPTVIPSTLPGWPGRDAGH